ncbi:MAG: PfkB family carbohydrate kinase [Actinomycetales bacterium]|jgi:fructoselysine 6-kinase
MPRQLLSVGDNVVDQYPQRGFFYPGGNAVNVAVHASRLGLGSAYIGAVGTDPAGEVVLSSLREEGVDTGRTRVVDGPNAYAVVEVVDGNRVFAKGDLGISVFELDEGDLALAQTVDIVHTGECSNVEAQVPHLARAARTLSFDFSERPWDYIEAIAPQVDVATKSAPGADRATGLEQARRLRALGPRTVAVTLGAEGAVVIQDEEAHWAPAGVGQIVDTLGAGDAFIARLLLGMTQGHPIADLVLQATHYATQTCASFGAFGHATSLQALSPATTQHYPDRLDVS